MAILIFQVFQSCDILISIKHFWIIGSDTDIEINHFLWTGDISSDEILQDTFDEESIEGEDGFSITQKIYPSPPHIKPTSVLETRCEVQ